jgi:hypothetical protein
MAAMLMVQVAAHQVVCVAVVGHPFVPAVWTVNVALLVRCAIVAGGAIARVPGPGGKGMLIDVVAVHMVHVAIVQIIGVAVMRHCGMTAVCVMRMLMIFVLRAGHIRSLLLPSGGCRTISAESGIALSVLLFLLPFNAPAACVVRMPTNPCLLVAAVTGPPVWRRTTGVSLHC